MIFYLNIEVLPFLLFYKWGHMVWGRQVSPGQAGKSWGRHPLFQWIRCFFHFVVLFLYICLVFPFSSDSIERCTLYCILPASVIAWKWFRPAVLVLDYTFIKSTNWDETLTKRINQIYLYCWSIEHFHQNISANS